MKYDAFISYRHMPLDMEIAKKLHKGLETFPVPAPVRESTGKKKIERVFRDQEELPIGSNLTEEITAALKESEFLIVVCSHYIPESIWVQREIETFISMHDRSHVLAILVEGEPEDSFPKQLTADDEGNPVEPLAADVRGATKQEQNKKFNTELLRLAAPILGCSYDDLKQRHRERMIRRMIIEVSVLAGVVAAAGALFGIYNANVAKEMEKLANDKAALAEQMSMLAEEKTQLADDIMLEYQEKLQNQSRFYAQKSQALMDQGNRRAAALVAMEALPSGDNERPYVPEAEYALSSALRVYDLPTAIGYDRNLHHNQVVRALKLCSDGKRVITQDRGDNLHVWSIDTWNEDMFVSHVVKENNYTADIVDSDADEDSVYIATTEGLYRYDNAGKLIWNEKLRDEIVQAEFHPDENEVFVVHREYVEVFDTRNGILIYTYDNETEESFSEKTACYPENGLCACAHFGPEEGGGSVISLVNVNENSMTDVKCSGNDIFNIEITESGNIAVVSSENDLLYSGGDIGALYIDLFDQNGEMIWTNILNINLKNWVSFRSNLCSQDYDDGNGTVRKGLAFSIEDQILYLNEDDGSLIQSLGFENNVELMLMADNDRFAYVVFDNGDIIPVDLEEGISYTGNAIRAGRKILEGLVVQDSILFRSPLSADVYIASFPRLSNYSVLPSLDLDYVDYTCYGWSAEGEYYVLCNDLEADYYFYDRDGNLIYSVDNAGRFILEKKFYQSSFLVASKDEMVIIDPVAGKTEIYEFEDMGVDSFATEVTLAENGAYIVCESGKKLYVIDVAAKNLIFSYEADEYVGKAMVTNDGSRLYISQDNTDLYYIDMVTGERTDIEGDRLRQVANMYSYTYMAMSSDSRFTAMCCIDEKVRIIENQTNRVIAEIPLGFADRVYLEFTSDCKFLITQGDDYRVRIWDLAEGKWIGFFDALYKINYSTVSEDKKYMAFFDLYGMYLVETGGYKQVAYVPYGITYITDDNSFIQRSIKDVFRGYCMSVEELEEEFKRQFPYDSLTDEERDMYNIN